MWQEIQDIIQKAQASADLIPHKATKTDTFGLNRSQLSSQHFYFLSLKVFSSSVAHNNDVQHRSLIYWHYEESPNL